MEKHLNVPAKTEELSELKSGDYVYLTGTIYTARDAAHKRMTEALTRGEQLPIDVKGNVMQYVGPSPEKPGQAVGSAGPTTSGRMDKYTPTMLEQGMKGMIGKGSRSQAVIDACVKNCAVYFVAIGGAAVVISQSIKKQEILAYGDLGPEAIRRYDVVDFPAIVCVDCYGNDTYKDGLAKYCKE